MSQVRREARLISNTFKFLIFSATAIHISDVNTKMECTLYAEILICKHIHTYIWGYITLKTKHRLTVNIEKCEKQTDVMILSLYD